MALAAVQCCPCSDVDGGSLDMDAKSEEKVVPVLVADGDAYAEVISK